MTSSAPAGKPLIRRTARPAGARGSARKPQLMLGRRVPDALKPNAYATTPNAPTA
jgi:hypothetical protein